MRVLTRHDSGATDFFWLPRRFGAFNIEFRVEANICKPIPLFLWFHADIAHSNLINEVIDYAMFAALSGPVNDPASFSTDPFGPEPIRIPGAISGGNILNYTQHYGQVSFAGFTDRKSVV